MKELEFPVGWREWGGGGGGGGVQAKFPSLERGVLFS